MCCCIPVRGSSVVFNVDEMLVVKVRPDDRDAMLVLLPVLLLLLLPLLANCTTGG